MIYTVTFNPALDYVMNLKQLQYKDINRTESEQLYYGGKGINVSVILSRLKVDNIALGFLAGFSGKKIEEMLNACLLYTSPSPRDRQKSRMPSSA